MIADSYRVRGLERVLTPALAIYDAAVDHNIEATVRAFGGDPDRWRPHIKTAKAGYVVKKYVKRGIRAMKCATTLELATACEAGAEDALLAYPVVGANAERVREIAAKYRNARVSALIENAAQAEAWRGSKVGTFVDVNPGMNRTGIDQDGIAAVVNLVCGLPDFRGLHYYDGHMHIANLDARRAAAHAGYSKLMLIVDALEAAGCAVSEVITSGTPALV